MTYLCQTNAGMPALTSVAGSMQAVVAAALSNPTSKSSTAVTLTVKNSVATVAHASHGMYDANSVELHSFSHSDLNGEKTARTMVDGYYFSTSAPDGTYSGSVRTATPAWSYGQIDTNIFWIRPTAAPAGYPYWVFDDRGVWHTLFWACPEFPTKFNIYGDNRWPRAAARQCAIPKGLSSGATDNQYKLIFRESSWVFDIITGINSSWFFTTCFGTPYTPVSDYATSPYLLSGWFAGTAPSAGLYNDTMGESVTSQNQWVTYDQPAKAWFASNLAPWDLTFQSTTNSASAGSGTDIYVTGDHDQVVALPYGVGLGSTINAFLLGYHDAVMFLPYSSNHDASPSVNAVTTLVNQQTGQTKLGVFVPVGSTGSNHSHLLIL